MHSSNARGGLRGRALQREWVALLAAWLISGIYLFAFVDRGWIPNDEGVLGQSAKRVLAGELPHVDFDAVYTGGLEMWNALAFRLLGVELVSIRWFLYLATLLFVPVVFRIARRVAQPLGAAAVSLLAVVWSVPNYFAGMPSWYNLFFASAGLLALLRHVETGRRRWLLLAGVFTGASFLIKSTGLLFAASVLLFLVYREQELSGPARKPGDSEARPGAVGIFAFRLFETVGVGLFVLVLATFVAQRPGWMEFIHHVVPGTALAAFLVVRVWRRPSGPAAPRFAQLIGSGSVFLGGALLPVCLFALPYLARGIFAQWATSGFLFQPSRLEFGVWALPIPATLVCALPVAALFAGPRLPWRCGRAGVALVCLAATLALALSSRPFVYQTVWLSLRPTVPILVIAGLAVLAGRESPRIGPARRQQVFLLLATVALASIFQFPYARAIYFCYIAALVVLAWLFVAGSQRGARRTLHLVAAAFYGLFALLWLNLGWIETMEYGFLPFDNVVRPAVPRAQSLRVDARSARLYDDLVATIQRVSEDGDYILATPDCAEIYFLANRRNPTPTLLDFLDDDFGTPERRERLLRTLEEHEVGVVVLRRVRVFTPLDPEFITEIEGRYPQSVPVGPFSVHWRPPRDETR